MGLQFSDLWFYGKKTFDFVIYYLIILYYDLDLLLN